VAQSPSSTATHWGGNALKFSSGSGASDTARTAYAAIAATTLEHAGDVLTLSFDFKGLVYANNNGNRVSFGFSNSGGSGDINDHLAYVGLLRDDLRTDRSPAYSQILALDEGLDFTKDNFAAKSLTTTVTKGTQFYLNGVDDGLSTTGNIGDVFHFSFSIARLENGGLLLNQTFTNTATHASFSSSATVEADDVLTYTFDTLTIGHYRVGADFAVDNVVVSLTSAIPEPGAAAALAAAAALGFAVSRRRARAGSR